MHELLKLDDAYFAKSKLTTKNNKREIIIIKKHKIRLVYIYIS